MTPSDHRSRRQAIYGRERERDRLRVLLDDAIAGHGSLVLISGEAGIGKTKLADDLIYQAEQQGCLVLTGACYDLTTTPPYGPWIEITRGYFAGDALPPLPEPLVAGRVLENVPSQGALYRLVADFFTDVATQRPLLLVLEDLHWSDLESPTLLRYLARELAQKRVLLVASYRTDELNRHHPLFQLIPVLVRESGAARVDLRRWGSDDISDLVKNRYQLGKHDLNRLVSYLDQQTEGNPLFIQEMLDTLEAEAILQRSGESWHLLDLDRAAVPLFVVQLIEGRLSKLDDATRELLEMAAVIGQEVSITLLRGLSGIQETDLTRALSQAFDLHLFDEATGTGVISFHHALVREALYSGIMLLRRQTWHRQLAEIMLELDHPDPDELVTHLEQSSDPRLLEWLIRSGNSAATRYAWDTAVERYERAVSLLELRGSVDPAQLCEVLLQLGDAQNKAGSGRGQDAWGPGFDPQAQSTFWKLAEVARDAGLPTYLAEAALGMAGETVITGHGGAAGVRLLAEALDQLPETDSELRARLLARRATGAMMVEITEALPDFATVEQIDAWSMEAVALSRRLQDRRTLAYVLHCRNAVIQGAGWHVERRQNSAEAVTLAAQLGDLPFLADALHSQMIYISMDGELRQAQEIFERFEAVVEQLGMPLFVWRAAVHRSGLALSSGPFDEARNAVEYADTIWPMSTGSRAQKLVVYRELDDLQALENLQQSSIPSPPLRDVVAMQYFLAADQVTAAQQVFESRLDDRHFFKPLVRRAGVPPFIVALLAETCAMLGDTKRAPLLYDYLLEYADQNIFARSALYSMGSGSHWLGLAAATMGKLDRAEGHFNQALERNEGWNLHPAAAYNRYEFARVILVQENEHDRARILLGEANDTACRLGMTRLKRLTATLMQTIRPAGVDSPAGLSPRETEVIELVVEGLSNPEIGERLYISPRTVSQHLRSVFNKLDVNNRAAAVARWVELSRG